MTAEIGDIAISHAGSESVRANLTEFYRDIDAQITARSPRCINRGKCCNFAKYGHRLYVTSIELAHFIDGQKSEWKSVSDVADQCPYHIGGVCTAREHRPLGCRVFFCEAESDVWPNEIYESGLERLKRISADHDVDYRYQEWLSALRSVPISADSNQNVDHPQTPADQKIDRVSLPVIES